MNEDALDTFSVVKYCHRHHHHRTLQQS